MNVEREAVEMRPWRPSDGPSPRVRVYPPAARPLLRIRMGGQWRLCPVRARGDLSDGRIAYHVDVRVREKEGWATFPRVYQWDPAVMRVVRP